MVFMEESELSSKRWASAPRRPDSPCVLGAPTSREAAGPPVQLEPVDLSVKTPVVLQVPRYSPAAALITAARRIPSPSMTPTPPPLCASTEAKYPSAMIGGWKANIEDFPWQAGVFDNDNFVCGATIIDKQHVVTAAHCVYNSSIEKVADKVSIVVGSNELEKGETHRVKAIKIHSGFDGVFPYPDDIAVMKIETEIEFDKTKKAIALPVADAPVGAKVKVTGWGQTYVFYRSKYLKKLDLTIMNNAECDTLKIGDNDYDNVDKSMYDEPLVPGQVCGLPRPATGLCEGDSGGPLVYEGSLVGIFSWKYQCGEGYPNVFTRVFNYVDWIRETIKLLDR